MAAGQHRGSRGKELLGQPRMTSDIDAMQWRQISSALRGQRPEQRLNNICTLITKRIIPMALKKPHFLRGAWPRTRAWVFPASAARWRGPGLRRRGCEAARQLGARDHGGESDDS